MAPHKKTDGELFDGAKFEDPKLKLESKEGARVDSIRLAFSGSMDLDRYNAGDVAFFKGLKNGKRITLEAEFTVGTDAEKTRFSTDGDPVELAAVKSLRVTGLTVA